MTELTPVSENSKSLAVIDDRFQRGDLQSWHENVDTNRRPILRMAWWVFIAVFGFGGLWAAIAPLGGSIVANGRVIAEDRNRIVQHLEGGILSELRVREGDAVVKGQIIAVLDDTQIAAQRQANLLQRAILRVQLARRRAETNEQTTIQFPDNIHPAVADNPRVREAIQSQREEFQAQLRFLAAGEEIADARIRGQQGDIEGLEKVIVAMDRQLELYQLELDDYTDLLAKGRIDRPRVFATERQVVDLVARLARTNLDIKAAQNNIETLANEKRQLKLKFSKESHAALVELQQQLNQIDGTVARLDDILKRLLVRAPENGTVFRISKRTLGAVLKPGEPIMEIFPDEDLLTIEAQLEVRHREKVFAGQEATLVFPGNRIESVTQYPARVSFVSPDVVLSEQNPQGNYVVQVVLSDVSAEIPNFLPGKQAQVFIKTTPKTFLDIILGPITRFTQNVFNE